MVKTEMVNQLEIDLVELDSLFWKRRRDLNH
jgi:hypothetical protein